MPWFKSPYVVLPHPGHIPLAVSSAMNFYDVCMGQTTREKLFELIEELGIGERIAKALILRMTTDECRDFLSDLKWERV